LTDEETLALLNLPTETIENNRYPLTRIRTLRGILAKFGPMGPAPSPPTGPPTPEERDPGCPRTESGRKSVPQLVEDEWANPREPAG
jgi:hypothetical protein